jgi:protein arginine kinase
MKSLRDMAIRPARWLAASAPHGDIILSSRVRLARNLEGRRFPHSTGTDGLTLLREEIVAGLGRVDRLSGADLWTMESLGELERRFLLERHLISVDLVRNVPGRALMVSEDEAMGIMVNEEDHLRLQTFSAGLSARAALESARALADAVETELPFARHDRLGYLTACPTNVGTGMRASVLAHLPGLSLSGDIEKVLSSLRRLNFTVRGFYGEGSGVMGALYQISNSVTLGVAEEEIVDELLRHTTKVLDCERQARKAVAGRDVARLEDRVWRAFAILSHSRMLSTREAFELLSDVRLGASQGILTGVDESVLNVLLMSVQGAHLQIAQDREMGPEQRDRARASYVRGQMAHAAGGNGSVDV